MVLMAWGISTTHRDGLAPRVYNIVNKTRMTRAGEIKMPKLRRRGTAVIIRHGKVLLVRDRGKSKFSLPGGGIEKGEMSINAAIREIREELGLKVKQATRARNLDFAGTSQQHHVTIIKAEGKPRLKSRELVDFMWWDGKSPLPVYDHVKGILKKLDPPISKHSYPVWEAIAEREAPDWVKNAIKRIFKHEGTRLVLAQGRECAISDTSKLSGTSRILKGKHFIYKVSFLGGSTTILRKRG